MTDRGVGVNLVAMGDMAVVGADIGMRDPSPEAEGEGGVVAMVTMTISMTTTGRNVSYSVYMYVVLLVGVTHL